VSETPAYRCEQALVFSMKYRNVEFKINIVGLDRWRWMILPRQLPGFTWVGQVCGKRMHAIAACEVAIARILEEEARLVRAPLREAA
jgi:hypothetical protein